MTEIIKHEEDNYLEILHIYVKGGSELQKTFLIIKILKYLLYKS